MTKNLSDNTPELLVNDPCHPDGSADSEADCVADGAADWEVILAHGAGVAMDSEFMEAFAAGLAEYGLRVIRFEFPYMAERRQTGRRRPPDREPVLRETWLSVIESRKESGKSKHVILGGKSLGGRIASLLVDEINQEPENKQPEISGLVCLGYPFHPTGKLDKLRTAHLEAINTPTLILQGERDPFGNRDEVAGYKLSQNIQLHWLADGDHSFKPRKASGRTEEQNWRAGIDAVAAFANELARKHTPDTDQ